MNGNDLMNVINNIDDSYITEFADTGKFQKKKPFYLSYQFYGSIAAVIAVCAGIMIAVSFHQDSLIVPAPVTQDTETVSSEKPIDDSEKDSDGLGHFNGIADSAKQTEGDTIAEEMHNPFSVKVYAAENSQPVQLTENPVAIKGDFNPLFSSSKGLGIEFEITCPANLMLQTDNGHFLTWDRQSGAIVNYGKEYSANGTVNLFWTLDNDFEWNETTFINVLDSSRNTISVIQITGDESTHTFTASLQND